MNNIRLFIRKRCFSISAQPHTVEFDEISAFFIQNEIKLMLQTDRYDTYPSKRYIEIALFYSYLVKHTEIIPKLVWDTKNGINILNEWTDYNLCMEVPEQSVVLYKIATGITLKFL